MNIGSREYLWLGKYMYSLLEECLSKAWNSVVRDGLFTINYFSKIEISWWNCN